MQRRRIALDEATPRQSQLVSELSEAAQPPGALSGIILGDGPWDVRLLTTEGDRSWVTRRVDPSLQRDTSVFDDLRLLLTWAASQSPTCASGESTGLLWYRRPYSPQVASDIAAPADPPDIVAKFTLLRDIARLVEVFHAASRAHGNVALANVLVDRDSTLTLVDPGFALYCPSARLGRSFLAPEVGTDTTPSTAMDIYSLGKVGRKLLSQPPVSAEVTRLFDVMLSNDASRRPSIHWVLGVLSELLEDQLLSAEHNKRPKDPLREGPGIESANRPESVHDRSPGSGAIVQSTLTKRQSAATASAISGQNESAPSPEHARPYAWMLIPLVVLAIIVAIIRFTGTQRREPIDFYTYWMSGQPRYMRDVAEAAIIDGDADARQAIIDAARGGFTSSLIRSEVLLAAVDPRWEQDLSDEDLTMVLRLAVSPLLRNVEPPMIPIEIHQGVLFGILARSPLEAKFPELQMIPPSRLQELPKPSGEVFKGLQALGVRSLDEREARAAAHLLANDIRPPILDAFVAPISDEARLLAKLDIVKDWLATNEQLATAVLGAIIEQSGSIRSFMSWFDRDELDTWKGIKPQVRFLVSLGVVPSDLSYEQLIDLLAFSRTSVRELAGRQLFGDRAYGGIHDILPFLVSPNNTLSRIQVISLAGALQTSGRDQLLLIHGWLKTKPSPLTVAHLLIARDGKESTDGFNLEASRYLLKARDLKLPREMLIPLANHTEPMARAYAYAALNPTIPDDRRILEAAQSAEKSPRLQKQLADLLR